MPAIDALTMKAILAEDISRNPVMRTMTLHVLASYVKDLAPSSSESPPSDSKSAALPLLGRPRQQQDAVMPALSLALSAAETFYVAPHMTDLTVAAAESYPDEDVLVEDLPAFQGFTWLPSPVVAIDLHGGQLRFHAVLWTAAAGGVDLYWFTDKYDELDSVNRDMTPEERARQPRLTLAHATRIGFGRSVNRTITNTGPRVLSPHVTGQRLPDENGQPRFGFAVAGPDDLDGVHLESRPDPTILFTLVMWRLMQQSLTRIRRDNDVPRRVRRELAKANQPDRHVSVIELRRRDPSTEHGDRSITWSHQWLVRGHWRRQPYKDANTGSSVHRTIWIHPHLKGPEGAPLLHRERVYALIR